MFSSSTRWNVAASRFHFRSNPAFSPLRIWLRSFASNAFHCASVFSARVSTIVTCSSFVSSPGHAVFWSRSSIHAMFPRRISSRAGSSSAAATAGESASSPPGAEKNCGARPPFANSGSTPVTRPPSSASHQNAGTP